MTGKDLLYRQRLTICRTSGTTGTRTDKRRTPLRRPTKGGSSGASRPVSRVLLFQTAIYLDVPLPTRSSHLHGTAGPACCPSTVLLRIEFTATDASTPSGGLLPPPFHPYPEPAGRYISVALFLGSPPADVIRYPCPLEPGLSSPPGLSPRQRGCPVCLLCYCSPFRWESQLSFR